MQPGMMPSMAQIVQSLQEHEQTFAHFGDQLTRVAKRVAVLEIRDALARAGRAPRLPLQLRSQFGEDLALLEIFAEQLDGYYIECGAFDGRTISVSWIFDAMGWNGLLVEGVPALHAQAAKHRPHARVEHAAVSRRGSSGTTKFSVVAGGAGGAFSFLNTNKDHLDIVRNSGAKTVLVDVPLTTMDDLLAKQPPKNGQVDFAVIDVEGGELDVLDGFDLERWKPRVLMLEDNSMGRDKTLERYMESKPYKQVSWVAVSRVYVRNDDARISALMNEDNFQEVPVGV